MFANGRRATRRYLIASVSLHLGALLALLLAGKTQQREQQAERDSLHAVADELSQIEQRKASRLTEIRSALEILKGMLNESQSDELISDSEPAEIPGGEQTGSSLSGAQSIVRQAVSLRREVDQQYRKLFKTKGWVPLADPPNNDTEVTIEKVVTQVREKAWHALAQKVTADSTLEDSTLEDSAPNGSTHGSSPQQRSANTSAARRIYGSAIGPSGPSAPQVTNEHDIVGELSAVDPRPNRVFVGSVVDYAWHYVDAWYTVGPFAIENATAARLISPQRPIDLAAVYQGKRDTLIHWQYYRSDVARILPETDEENSVHYAYTELRSDRKRSVWLALGADDSMHVWLNGELIWDCGNHLRSWIIDEGARPATLRKGYNRLLVRLTNYPDEGAFSVAIRLTPAS